MSVSTQFQRGRDGEDRQQKRREERSARPEGKVLEEPERPDIPGEMVRMSEHRQA